MFLLNWSIWFLELLWLFAISFHWFHHIRLLKRWLYLFIDCTCVKIHSTLCTYVYIFLNWIVFKYENKNVELDLPSRQINILYHVYMCPLTTLAILLMSFCLLARKTFDFPIFRLWAYLMKVIHKRVVCTKLDIHFFYFMKLNCQWHTYVLCCRCSVKDIRVVMFNATFKNISVISWRSVSLVEDT